MKHIAVVEDEALMREELADMLRRAGYTVTEITDFSDVTRQLLETLLAHGGQTVAKNDLSRALWGTTEFIDENALQVNLTRLKKTMASLGMRQQLVSVRGVGYRLEVPHEA